VRSDTTESGVTGVSEAILDVWLCRCRVLFREKDMLDIVFILATGLFFGIGILYVRGCERLK